MDDEPTAVCDAQIYSSVRCWSSISLTFRIAKYLARRGKSVSNIPLQRFSKIEIEEMVAKAGFDVSTLKFSDNEPFWTFSVKKVK